MGFKLILLGLLGAIGGKGLTVAHDEKYAWYFYDEKVDWDYY